MDLPSCVWDHLQAEQLLYNDPDNTPIANLSAGNLFKGKPAPAASLSSTGSADLNGDGKTAVFRTIPFDANNLRWQYSSGGAGAWQNPIVATTRLPTANLQFGEFNGDAHSDVFADDNYSGTNHWEYSAAGLNAFTSLHTAAGTPLAAPGDFNAESVTDVFTATKRGSTYQ